MHSANRVGRPNLALRSLVLVPVLGLLVACAGDDAGDGPGETTEAPAADATVTPPTGEEEATPSAPEGGEELTGATPEGLPANREAPAADDAATPQTGDDAAVPSAAEEDEEPTQATPEAPEAPR